MYNTFFNLYRRLTNKTNKDNYKDVIPNIRVKTIKNPSRLIKSDSKNKVYANLIVHDDGAKPSEADCTKGLKALQDVWDLENDSYKSKRQEAYPSIADQLDDLYHNGIDGWKTTIKAIKDKYPKG